MRHVHAGRVEMLLPDSMAGLVIVALRYLGRDAVSGDTLRHIDGVIGHDDRVQLGRVRRQVSGWLGTALDQLAA